MINYYEDYLIQDTTDITNSVITNSAITNSFIAFGILFKEYKNDNKDEEINNKKDKINNLLKIFCSYNHLF